MTSSAMDDRFNLRRAVDTDNVLLSQLNRQTFRETYIDGSNIVYSKKDIDNYFRSSVSPESFADKIADPKQATWVIEDKTNSQFVAFANAGPSKMSFPDVQVGKDGQFHRLYILRDYQDYGFGDHLMKLGLSWLEEQFPKRPMWLGVWKGNSKAQEFHKQHGFRKVGEHYYKIGEYKRPSFVMRRENSSS